MESYLHTATCPHSIQSDFNVTPLLDGGELSASQPGTYWTECWVGPWSQGQHGCFGEGKVFSPCQQQNPDSLDVQPIADSLWWLNVQQVCAVNKMVHTIQKVRNTEYRTVSLQVIQMFVSVLADTCWPELQEMCT